MVYNLQLHEGHILPSFACISVPGGLLWQQVARSDGILAHVCAAQRQKNKRGEQQRVRSGRHRLQTAPPHTHTAATVFSTKNRGPPLLLPPPLLLLLAPIISMKKGWKTLTRRLLPEWSAAAEGDPRAAPPPPPPPPQLNNRFVSDGSPARHTALCASGVSAPSRPWSLWVFYFSALAPIKVWNGHYGHRQWVLMRPRVQRRGTGQPTAPHMQIVCAHVNGGC